MGIVYGDILKGFRVEFNRKLSGNMNKYVK